MLQFRKHFYGGGEMHKGYAYPKQIPWGFILMQSTLKFSTNIYHAIGHVHVRFECKHETYPRKIHVQPSKEQFSIYRPSAPLLYEVACHVKQLPFRPLLLLLLPSQPIIRFSVRFYHKKQCLILLCKHEIKG